MKGVPEMIIPTPDSKRRGSSGRNENGVSSPTIDPT
jgi:hypothetical protein